jgi:hypothetical protein
MSPRKSRGVTLAAAPSTGAGNKSAYYTAYSHFDKMQEARGDPNLEQLPDTADEDTVVKLLNDFDGECQSGPQTNLGYFGKLKVALAAKYSTLMMWEKEEKWYKPLYNDLKVGSERLYLLSDKDHIDSKCYPFYLEVQPTSAAHVLCSGASQRTGTWLCLSYRNALLLGKDY